MKKYPKSVSTSELDLGDFILHFHTLDNGQKIIEAEDMEEFIRRLENGSLTITKDNVTEIESFIAGLT